MNSRWTLVLCSALLLCCHRGIAQGIDVTAKFVVVSHPGAAVRKSGHTPALNDVVLWLTRVDVSGPVRSVTPPKAGYRLVQKNKEFWPHLLVVPAGSSVEFPNMDPFFHNVFSLFNGKRFDLGLYEAGTHRSVRFDREGVSYIFCNIHPEMGAIVLALNSPYYAVSDKDGTVTIPNVPAGKYHLHIWSEQFQNADAAAEQRTIQITMQNASLGTIDLTSAASPLMHHKNKFGEDYPAVPAPKY